MAKLTALLITLALMLMSGVAEAAKRVALVIGNANYSEVATLTNPLNDVPLIAKALTDAGFEDVKVVRDLDTQTMREELQAFSDRASGAEVALVYYAGHGVEIANVNYLVPVNARLRKAKDAAFEAIALSDVRTAVSGARKLRVVILDACRNNPFKLVKEDGTRAGRRIGLVEVKPGVNELIAYSAQEGVVADDGPADGNSPFATALVRWLGEPGMEIRFVMGHVRDEVMANTGPTEDRDGPQIPYIEGSLGGEQIVLKAAVDGKPGPTEKKPEPPPDSLAGDFDLARSLGTKEAWELFIARHGEKNDMRVDMAKREYQKFAAIIPVPPPELKPGTVLRVANRFVPIPMPKPDCVAMLLASVGGSTKCLEVGKAFTDCVGCPEMVVVPAGSFTMGSPESEAGRYPYEGPMRTVTIARPFAVGRFEITRSQFAEFVRDSGFSMGASCYVLEDGSWNDTSGKSFRDPGFKQADDHPVVCVSWEDAQAYAKWLSKKTGQTYRLLSEAEWEYAARAGTQTAYATGDSISTSQANFNKTLGGTVKVGNYAANSFGLNDMHGNVGEWVQDCYERYDSAPNDGTARQGNSGCDRVDRGGGWGNTPRVLRSANGGRVLPETRSGALGFRLARTIL